MTAFCAKARHLGPDELSARLARGPIVGQPMMPKRIEVGRRETGEFPVLVERNSLNALLQRHLQARARALAVCLYPIEHVSEQGHELLPLRLIEHRNVDLATPAVDLLRHGLESR